MALKMRRAWKNRRVQEAMAGHISGRPLPLITVDRMFELYCQDYTPPSIAEIVGISHATVLRYVNDGDPKRSIEPFAQRRARLLKAVFDRGDEKLTERF